MRQLNRIPLTMPTPGRSQQAADDGLPDAPGMALVPLMPAVPRRRVPYRQLSRADFVTHLIATAEHAPQTRQLRRATPADAQTAYQAQRPQVPALGVRTRQMV
jgi:hypothetical protein